MAPIDLSAGYAKVLGNRGDEHTFRLSNPTGEAIIIADGDYEADFTSPTDKVTPVSLDESEVPDGILSFTLTIQSGQYRVRRLDPQQRTILVVDVEVK